MPLSLSHLCEDVILLISDHLSHTLSEYQQTPLKNLSLTNHHFRTLLLPRIFKTIHINRPTSQLTPTPLLSHHAQTFKIDMFGSMWWWCSGAYTSSSDALDLLRCIQSMQNLSTLEISMMKRSTDIYTAAFGDERVTNDAIFILDRVEKLVVTSSAAFLATHCPNLKSLIIQDGSECLIDSYTDLTTRLSPLHPRLKTGNLHLTHFDATATWSATELQNLVESYPNLQSLRMRTETWCYHAPTHTIIQILAAELTHLRTLHLVKAGSLGLGYQCVWKRKIEACSDAEYRVAMWVENERLRVAAENGVVREAFGRIGGLGECWLGERRVARRVGGGGWMWERRREEGDEGGVFARMRREKEGVVVGVEFGC